ncbi:hypothetical protein TURU_082423 [Turdus rufiventris]|nr:hypothetical protein TURU_082423 [Turdus rufiventris]
MWFSWSSAPVQGAVSFRRSSDDVEGSRYPLESSGKRLTVVFQIPDYIQVSLSDEELNHAVGPLGAFLAKDWPTDIDECALKIHTCWNDSACVNLAGGFDCLCPSGPSCTGDCPHEGGFKRNGQVWTLREDRCSVCSCKDGRIFCRRTACDCGNPSADLFCCPECDTRVTSQCLDQTGHKLYRSGDNWTYSCQQCRCLEGEVDCWPLQCPTLNCEYTAISEGECCPHCVSDPCLADNITYDIRKTCPDGYGITRLSGAVWTMVGSPCTTCKCKAQNRKTLLNVYEIRIRESPKYVQKSGMVLGLGSVPHCILSGGDMVTWINGAFKFIPPFPYGSLSGPLLMQPDLEILCTSSEAADLPYLLLKLSSTPQRHAYRACDFGVIPLAPRGKFYSGITLSKPMVRAEHQMVSMNLESARMPEGKIPGPQTKFLQAPSSLALNASSDGTSTASLGNLSSASPPHPNYLKQSPQHALLKDM